MFFLFRYYKRDKSHARTDIKAYKNVYKRVKRLQSLGLIQEILGNFKRKAKIFRLSPRGLFEELLEPYPWPPDIRDQYRNYPIIETLVYQFSI